MWGTTEILIATVSNVVNQGVRDVHLLMSSSGGVVMCGLSLYNTLRGFPIHLTTHNVGNMRRTRTAYRTGTDGGTWTAGASV